MNNVALTGPDREPHRYILLHGRYAVLYELINFVRAQLDGFELSLRPGKRYTARALMGDPCWKLLTKEEKRLTGSVIAHFAAHGELPLRKIEKRAIGEANRYVWTGEVDAGTFERQGLRVVMASGGAPVPNARGRSSCQS